MVALAVTAPVASRATTASVPRHPGQARRGETLQQRTPPTHPEAGKQTGTPKPHPQTVRAMGGQQGLQHPQPRHRRLVRGSPAGRHQHLRWPTQLRPTGGEAALVTQLRKRVVEGPRGSQHGMPQRLLRHDHQLTPVPAATTTALPGAPIGAARRRAVLDHIEKNLAMAQTDETAAVITATRNQEASLVRARAGGPTCRLQEEEEVVRQEGGTAHGTVCQEAAAV